MSLTSHRANTYKKKQHTLEQQRKIEKLNGEDQYYCLFGGEYRYRQFKKLIYYVEGIRYMDDQKRKGKKYWEIERSPDLYEDTFVDDGYIEVSNEQEAAIMEWWHDPNVKFNLVDEDEVIVQSKNVIKKPDIVDALNDHFMKY